MMTIVWWHWLVLALILFGIEMVTGTFDLLMAWLANLQQQYGVRVDGAIIGASSAPGLVNANLTLAHGQSPAS